ncbi:ATP-binding protein [Flavobacterium psychraquaticum]|uniref:ATP-binding protein n=1 Tax=Flavobacterium psychraquaticum TaxID=3103958 RepID=UPI002ACD5CFE|nr:ATP-binding protein [Flavobacterium sp. LB-N7T]
MKHIIILFSLFFLVGCNPIEDKSVVKDKLDLYFEKSSDINLNNEIKLKFTDSAKVLIEEFKSFDSLAMKNYFKLANRYFTLRDYDNYKLTTDKILKISQSNKDSINIAKAEYYLGDYYLNISKNDSAYYYYLSAEKKYEKIKDLPNLANTILHKAYVLYYEKDFLGSESETIRVLNFANDVIDELLIYECYSHLGASLSGLGDYEKALEYHQKALLEVKKIKNEVYKAIYQAQTLNNIGFVYLNVNKLNEASQIFSEGLKIKDLEDLQPVLYASLLDNYSYSRFKINPEEGLEDFKKVLNFRNEISDIQGKVNSLNHLTEYYLAQKDTVTALDYNKEAYKLAKESNFNREVLISLDFFTKLLPKEGLAYAKEYIKLNDDLQRKERATRNKLARIEFETDEIISEKEKISNQQQFILISSLLIISFGFLFYIILYQRGKHKDFAFKQQQQESNEEIYRLMLNNQEEINEVRNTVKRSIALDLHDNILNRLASTRLNLFAISRVQDEVTIKKAIDQVEAIRVIEQEIRAFSHELYNDSILSKSNFKNILEELVKSQQETYSLDCKLIYDDTINEIVPEIKMNVYRIIQEAFNNINKYANATKVMLYLDFDAAGFLCLEIYDNGSGFNTKKVKEGIGLKNMKSRTETIKGELHIESEKNKGTRITLKVKL